MNALWIPIFSMRSYETGKYAILKDGNFQLTLARALASDFEKIMIGVPEDSSDFDELLARFENEPRLRFTQLLYGANAVETRETFWQKNGEYLDLLCQDYSDVYEDWTFDVLISDITGEHGTVLPVIYNFNITKLPELDRPYIDKFFEEDIRSIERSLFTTVINPRQRDYILEVRPDLHDRVIAHYKVAHESLLPAIAPPSEEWSRGMKKIFWPFRISDKAYKFIEFMQAFEDLGLDKEYEVLITDPNDTLKYLKDYMKVIRPSKSEYYELMANRFTIVMLDDIDTVLHPGTIEFLHYGCPVITFHSRLIDNPNGIDNLSELGGMLANVEYNAVDASPFVYKSGEVDAYYNQDFINVRKN